MFICTEEEDYNKMFTFLIIKKKKIKDKGVRMRNHFWKDLEFCI